MVMRSTCGNDEEWAREMAESVAELFPSDLKDRDSKLRPLSETGVNHEPVPYKLPPEDFMENLQPLPENEPAVTSFFDWRNRMASSSGSSYRSLPQLVPRTLPRLILQPIGLEEKIRRLLGLLPGVSLEPCKEDSVAGDLLSKLLKFKDGHVARAKRLRAPDWSVEEKRAYLELKEEALWVVVGKDWDFISQGLRDRHGFDRSSKCCEDLWGTLRKDVRAIRGHDASKSDAQTSNWVSYWEMDEDGRSRNKLPRLFPLQSYNTMERILATQEQRKGEHRKIRRIPVQKSFGDEDQYSHLHPAYPSGGGSNQQTRGEGSRMTDPGGPPNLKHAGITFEEDDQTNWIAPLVKDQVEDAVNSALHRLRPCRESRSGATSEEDDPMATLSLLVQQLVEDAVTSAIRPVSCKKRTGATIDEDDLITGLLAPYLKKQIAGALSSALAPISSALQVREQEEQEYQEQLRALAEKKRALELEELQIKRRRVGRHPCTSSASSKQRGPREKNSSPKAFIIPTLEGLNIARDEDQVKHS